MLYTTSLVFIYLITGSWYFLTAFIHPLPPTTNLISFSISFVFCFFKINFFIFWLCWVFVAARGLSLVLVSGELLFVEVHGLLIAVASLVAEHGL